MHTDFDFLSLVYPIDRVDNEAIKPLHRHDYYELVYVRQGKVIFQLDVSSIMRSTELYRDNFMIVEPGISHRFVGVEQTACVKIGFVMRAVKNLESSCVYFEDCLKKLGEKVMLSDGFLTSCINQLVDSGNDLFVAERKKAAFTLFLLHICGKANDNAYSETNKNILKNGHNAKDIISNALLYHYTTDITVHDVAASSFLCVRQIDRICKQMYGRSFSAQKNFFRIENAKKLLECTNKTITYIAMQCGYNTTANFYRAFKKETGISVGDYKKLKLQK